MPEIRSSSVELALASPPSAPPGAASRAPRGRRRPARGASSSVSLPLDVLLLARSDALLDLQRSRLRRSCDLLLDLGAEPDRLLPRLDLRLAPERLGLALASASRSWRVRRAAASARAGERVERQDARPAPTARPIAIPMTTAMRAPCLAGLGARPGTGCPRRNAVLNPAPLARRRARNRRPAGQAACQRRLSVTRRGRSPRSRWSWLVVKVGQ